MLTNELSELYQEVILDHQKNPRNRRALPEATHEAQGHNPLCGDQVKVYLSVEDGVIQEASFEGAGCAISTASASLMTEMLRGKTCEEAERLFHSFRDLLTENTEASETFDELGKLCVLAGVKEFPVRVKCATLACHTFRAALSDEKTPVSTET